MKVSNIVATVKLKGPLDLDYLCSKIKNIQRHPKVHWLKYRIPDNNSYIAFYKSGKFLVTAKSLDQLDNNLKFVLLSLQEIGILTEGWILEIHNIVVVDDIKLTGPLENIISNMDIKKASYEPEQFPALVYKDWNVSFLLFSSGKVILAGAKTLEQAIESLKLFKELITAIN